MGSNPNAHARPTYSRLRTGILSLTPGDTKCRWYCKGGRCRYCIPGETSPDLQAIPGLYSTWITDDILAMGRLSKAHFDEMDIVNKLRRNDIVAVVNLEEEGEHSFCGAGIGPSGFSYEPQRLMDSDIYHLNFPLPDFGGCAPSHLLDISIVINHFLSKGRIAVHCHAGHGRTGMVIAAVLMIRLHINPRQAVQLVRSRRHQSVQSHAQSSLLNSFHHLLFLSGSASLIPPEKLNRCSHYVLYSARFISKFETRLYGTIPKPVYLILTSLLQLFFFRVQVTFDPSSRTFHSFRFDCSQPTGRIVSEDSLSSLFPLDPSVSLQLYGSLAEKGMNIINMHTFVESLDAISLLRLLDHFWRASFHQLANIQQIISILTESTPSSTNEDWYFPVCFLLGACLSTPRPLRGIVAGLIGTLVAGRAGQLEEEMEKMDKLGE